MHVSFLVVLFIFIVLGIVGLGGSALSGITSFLGAWFGNPGFLGAALIVWGAIAGLLGVKVGWLFAALGLVVIVGGIVFGLLTGALAQGGLMACLFPTFF